MQPSVKLASAAAKDFTFLPIVNQNVSYASHVSLACFPRMLGMLQARLLFVPYYVRTVCDQGFLVFMCDRT